MVTDNQGGERSQFLDELISLEEAIERLEGAKLITENQQHKIDQLYIRIAQLDGHIGAYKERIDYLQSVSRSLALDLARAGGYDHKGKNERILQVVTRLLEIAVPREIRYFSPETNRDFDDLPF